MLIGSTQLLHADIKLPSIVSSNMVLQRNTQVTLWGWADVNEEITIKASWLDEYKKLKADDKGNWRIDIQTTNSKEPQKVSFRSKTSQITLDNVLFGEVWLCSGQSNMFQPLKGYNAQPTFGSTMAIAKSSNPNLRLFAVDRVGSKTPLKDLSSPSSWKQATPETVASFSAIGYFFAQQLQEILGVPVGIIHTSWGASTVEAWISKEVMNSFQEFVVTDEDIIKKPNRTATALFNSMIKPLIPYNIKGVLWYQGEGNRNEPNKYKQLLPVMVKDWRNRWGLGDFPFYYVQIAPYAYGGNDAYTNPQNSAFMREAQLECLELIPNSGIAITTDLGSFETIHPPKKKEVADRLLFNALNQTYGFKDVDFVAPTYESHVVKNDSIIVNFKNAEMGLFSFNELEDFEIAGEDKVFYPASAKIINQKSVQVFNKNVTKPVAVRYAWKNWVIGTLYDTNLLPASSFRTDRWEDATQVKSMSQK
ncbi:sialate O-acetylesterase [Siansivirga zeaxanthinifaciens]|uniref:9-O-acetylesterase n=1 Tax=Siansivirga zeaxanthinifaciens CC-SAMT-1 TaxID=1454006 RepID=A0A0C5WNJ7_9FLAO|nr:sialate O-acetylesterase [Siansivirga zeaxanthinifaciens]AJR04475.1 9-O-acetylesterase [Siansivirga zeaxanthinifaciens CC-SAMT-1]